jgi:BirA family biotin operon repressor/biotin-[acetyl-CoA-carboxylase] ligase
MLIYTDSPEYTHRILTYSTSFVPLDSVSIPNIPLQILDQLYPEKNIYTGSTPEDHRFKNLFISEFVPFSQFDMLLRYAKMENILREDMLCFAGSGNKFRGFRQRQWTTVPGNIHLSLLLNPGKYIEHAETAFLILAANAVTQTINDLENIQKKAMIHWVNDIMIDSCKVGGVLAQTQIQGNKIDKVVLGIGLNVDQSPEINRNLFVKEATHINKFISGDNYPLNQILFKLIKNLARNYTAILQNSYHDLLNYYIDHSLLIGKRVDVYSDPREGQGHKIAEGVVSGITENLELIIAGRQDLIRKGRIILLNST